MSQTSIIAGSILVAFIIYITLKGDLAGYIEALRGVTPDGGDALSANGGSNGDNSDSGGSFSDSILGDLSTYGDLSKFGIPSADDLINGEYAGDKDVFDSLGDFKQRTNDAIIENIDNDGLVDALTENYNRVVDQLGAF